MLLSEDHMLNKLGMSPSGKAWAIWRVLTSRTFERQPGQVDRLLQIRSLMSCMLNAFVASLSRAGDSKRYTFNMLDIRVLT